MTWAEHWIGRTDMHCWELVREIYAKQLNIALPSYGEVDAKALAAVSAAVDAGKGEDPWKPVKPFPGAEQLFDVVVMTGWLGCADGRARRGVIHTGVCTGDGHVLHTDMRDAVVYVPLSHPTVRRRLVGCYRHVAFWGE